MGATGRAALGRLRQTERHARTPGWELVWSDEFDGATLDAVKWNVQTGDGSAEGIPGWGNNELQSYRAANIAVADGVLVITARQEHSGDGHAYTSGRINTAGKLDITYGRIEASIQAPAGQGLWSAFWMLPTGSAYGTWAAGGEIDILEVFSRDPEPFAQAALHYGMAWPLNTHVYAKYADVDPAEGFHVYAVEWDAEEIRWYVDGTHYYTVRRSTYWNRPSNEERLKLFGMGGASEPGDFAGELQFDLYVFGDDTDAAGSLAVKLDSGFPDVGAVELPLATFPRDEWTTATVQISDIVRSPSLPGGRPVNLDQVLGLFVLETSSFARLQVDDIRLVCGHVEPGGCGIEPPSGSN